jgi:hypothetical protein
MDPSVPQRLRIMGAGSRDETAAPKMEAAGPAHQTKAKTNGSMLR